MDRGDVDDLAPAAPFREMASDKLAEVESARQRALQRLFEEVRVVVEKITAAAEGGIAHEDVESSRFGERGGDEGLASTAREDVRLDRPALPPEGSDGFGGGSEIGAAGSVVQHEVGTGLRQSEGAAFADSTTSPGDKGDFSGKFHSQQDGSLPARSLHAKRKMRHDEGMRPPHLAAAAGADSPACSRSAFWNSALMSAGAVWPMAGRFSIVFGPFSAL